MIVTLDAKRRLTVPTGLAPASPGDYFDARFDETDFEGAPVSGASLPEPSGILLLSSALVGLACFFGYKKRRSKA